MMSYDLVKRSALMTILHVTVFEGRLDVLQVLFDSGLIREFKDVTIKDERSTFKGKKVEEIVQSVAYAKMRDKLADLCGLEETLTWLHRCARIAQLESVQVCLP